jgi:ribokinase
MMTKILNVGSINIDYVYTLTHFVKPAETLRCENYQRFAGGKGLNQSIALAQALAEVYHAGNIGLGDTWLSELMATKGVNTQFVNAIDAPTGHAIIQVNQHGENAIIIEGGANQLINENTISDIIGQFQRGDYLLLQNEINAITAIMHRAKEQGLSIVFNPAPITKEVLTYPLELVDVLIVNETEAQALTGETEVDAIYAILTQRYSELAVIITLGKSGAFYFDKYNRIYQPAYSVQTIDSTGAGDTFIGFYLAEYIKTKQIKTALQFASIASALSVTRHGAAIAIPSRLEVQQFYQSLQQQ